MDIESLSKALLKIKEEAEAFYRVAEEVCPADLASHFSVNRDTNHYWDILGDVHQKASLLIQKDLLSFASSVIPVMKSSLLLNEADERAIGLCIKRMRAALRLRNFRSWNVDILHDEGTVLGVSPPGQSEDEPSTPPESRKVSSRCIDELEGMLELLSATPSNIPDGLPPKNPNLPHSYRPNTAFVMMSISPSNPATEDVYDTYKQSFELFGIKAIRADEIEHEDVITKRIIEEIKTSEFLVGDLTDERPSVYYEIGYAHSLGRRVMMYRKEGSSIHFDLAAYNCPEYKNMRELKELLLKRLEDATSRKPEKG